MKIENAILCRISSVKLSFSLIHKISPYGHHCHGTVNIKYQVLL